MPVTPWDLFTTGDRDYLVFVSAVIERVGELRTEANEANG